MTVAFQVIIGAGLGFAFATLIYVIVLSFFDIPEDKQ
jgi:hypothetical protein